MHQMMQIESANSSSELKNILLDNLDCNRDFLSVPHLKPRMSELFAWMSTQAFQLKQKSRVLYNNYVPFAKWEEETLRRASSDTADITEPSIRRSIKEGQLVQGLGLIYDQLMKNLKKYDEFTEYVNRVMWRAGKPSYLSRNWLKVCRKVI
jgi:hypothetical protein